MFVSSAFLDKLNKEEESSDGAVCEELETLLKEEEEWKRRLESVEGKRAELAKAMEKEREVLKKLEQEEQKYQ